MVEYYKLSFVRKVDGKRVDEEIYLEINGDKPKIIAHLPKTVSMYVMNSKIEKITDELAENVLRDLQVDSGR
jgi:ribosomal protein S25